MLTICKTISPRILTKPFGLYYKQVTIVNEDSSIINKFEASLTHETRVIIYDHHMFTVQATGHLLAIKKFYQLFSL